MNGSRGARRILRSGMMGGGGGELKAIKSGSRRVLRTGMEMRAGDEED